MIPRARRYGQHLIKCPNCKYILAVKNGHNRQGKQRFMCKLCGLQYIAEKGKRVRLRPQKRDQDRTQKPQPN